MRALVSGLSRVVRRDGGVLFTQNGAASIGPTLRYYDGWNREDVSATYNFDRSRYERQTANEVQTAQAEIRRFTRRGLFVSGTDYVPPDDSVQTEESRNAICQAGAAPFVADIDLKRVPGVPLRCR